MDGREHQSPATVIKHLPCVPYTPYPIYGLQQFRSSHTPSGCPAATHEVESGLQNVNAAPQGTLGPGQPGSSSARGHRPGAMLETANLRQQPGLPASGSALTGFPAETETQANQLAPAPVRPHPHVLLTWGNEVCQQGGAKTGASGRQPGSAPSPDSTSRQWRAHNSASPLSPAIDSLNKHLVSTYCVLSPGLDKPAPRLQSSGGDRGTKAEVDESTVTGWGPRRTMRRRLGGHRRPADGFTCQCTE